MRPALLHPLVLSLLLGLPACSDDGTGSTNAPASTSTTAPGTTTTSGTSGTSTSPTTGDTGSTGAATSSSTGDPGSTTAELTSSSGPGPTTDDTGSTTMDPNCPPVKGAYNDCTDEMGKIDNTLCKWMGTGENGFITCLNAASMSGASTCSLVNCELDCHCFNQPETGTAKSICKKMATDKGDNACVLDCSNGATCPDGMVCSDNICFWPAP